VPEITDVHSPKVDRIRVVLSSIHPTHAISLADATARRAERRLRLRPETDNITDRL
jgi:hypothetical protein